MHSSNYGKKQAEIVNLIKNEKPDIILLGGDIFDDGLLDNKTLEFLSGIKQMDHVFYVSGNHEIWSNRYKMMQLQLRNNNITVLSGDNKVIEIKGQNISILGIDDPEFFGSSTDNEGVLLQLEKLSKAINNEDFQILLAHRPELINEYKRYPFDLLLSGHAHGGQWRIPYILNGILRQIKAFFQNMQEVYIN